MTDAVTAEVEKLAPVAAPPPGAAPPASRAGLIEQTRKTLAVLEAARDPADVIKAERLRREDRFSANERRNEQLEVR
jgi:hypothetical protein